MFPIVIGGLPQPGPIFAALPEPLSLPPLPQPQQPMAAASAPDGAPAGRPQPGSVLQVSHGIAAVLGD